MTDGTYDNWETASHTALQHLYKHYFAAAGKVNDALDSSLQVEMQPSLNRENIPSRIALPKKLCKEHLLFLFSGNYNLSLLQTALAISEGS